MACCHGNQAAKCLDTQHQFANLLNSSVDYIQTAVFQNLLRQRKVPQLTWTRTTQFLNATEQGIHCYRTGTTQFLDSFEQELHSSRTPLNKNYTVVLELFRKNIITVPEQKYSITMTIDSVIINNTANWITWSDC